jgi:hypothetical protein
VSNGIFNNASIVLTLLIFEVKNIFNELAVDYLIILKKTTLLMQRLRKVISYQLELIMTTNVVDFFTKNQVRHEDEAIEAKAAKLRIPKTDFSKPTRAQITASKDHDFRGDWKVTLAAHKRLGLDLGEIIKHQVTLSDIGKAIAIASVLADDREAAEYFLNLATEMVTTQRCYFELRQVPDSFKGYVWSIDFQKIINAEVYVEYQLGCIIGKPIIRHIFL